MIVGAHAIIYSKAPELDRAFLRDVLELPHVDAGDGWLVFGLPPAELAVHPSDENDVHEVYLMTGDVEALVASMRARGIEASPISNQGWGLMTRVTLPGGGQLGVYEPRHPRPAVATGRGGPRRRKATARRRGAATRKRTRRR